MIIDMDSDVRVTPTLTTLPVAASRAPTDDIKLEGTTSVLLKTQKIRGQIQLAALCSSLFLIGWNDGCAGPLLPRIQEAYHVGHRDH